MNQKQRLLYLIEYLLKEQNIKNNIPENEDQQKLLLRSLMNIRLASPISDDILKVQDEYLQEELSKERITDISSTECIEKNIYLWQGDITLLKVDAIVNAANSALLGCFIPNHRCIDNAIHSKAGIQLRLACNEIVNKEVDSKLDVGLAQITSAYNLPSNYIIHTVGPCIMENVSEEDCRLLAMCYRNSLKIAQVNNIKSIAFCCISTGEYRFPNELAAEIAISEVKDYLKNTNYKLDIIFNVYKDKDYEIYKKLLS